MNLFFFGTLLDDDVRRIVCGRDLPVQPASVSGFRRLHVAGRHYPMLVRHRPGLVHGAAARDVDGEALRRLQIYEGWEYRLQDFTAQTAEGLIPVQIFMCTAEIQAAAPEWRLDRWVLRHKRAFLPQLRRQMDAALNDRSVGSKKKSAPMWPGA